MELHVLVDGIHDLPATLADRHVSHSLVSFVAFANDQFLLDKDPLFARINLSDEEYALYDKVFSHLKPQTPTPDLVVYLQAPVDTLIERVHRRGIDFEQSIPAEYLARLADAYTRFFYRYSEAPLLIVNSERLNFVDDAAHVELLLGRVASMRGQREFFNLGPA